MKSWVFSHGNPSPLSIIVIGYSDDYESTRSKHDKKEHYVVQYVLKGQGYYRGNPVKKGQGFFLRPNEYLECYSDPNDQLGLLWIISDDDKIEKVFERYNADPETQIFDCPGISEARSVADWVVKNTTCYFDSYVMLEMYMRVLNCHLPEKSAPRLQSNTEVYLEFCTKYVKNNLNRKLKVSDLTSLCGVTQSYLYKIFKEKYGTSVKDYITTAKMSQAKHLLRGTQMTITEVAAAVGFDDILSFSKAFKLNEKVSPSSYRETQRTKEASS